MFPTRQTYFNSKCESRKRSNQFFILGHKPIISVGTTVGPVKYQVITLVCMLGLISASTLPWRRGQGGVTSVTNTGRDRDAVTALALRITLDVSSNMVLIN